MSPRPEVLATPTNDVGAILGKLHNVNIAGEFNNFSAALSIAHLALKHRPNRNQKTRIMAFIGSPLLETEDQLKSLGKKLKKNNVAVDVISFGDSELNQPKLEAFLQSVQKGDTCHLISIPPTINILADALMQSEVSSLVPEQMQQYAEFGFNPEHDPELAMVLRISAEEAKA